MRNVERRGIDSMEGTGETRGVGEELFVEEVIRA